MFCPKCGKEVPVGAEFCPGCGTKLIQGAAPAQPQNPVQPQSPAQVSPASGASFSFFNAPNAGLYLAAIALNVIVVLVFCFAPIYNIKGGMFSVSVTVDYKTWIEYLFRERDSTEVGINTMRTMALWIFAFNGLVVAARLYGAIARRYGAIEKQRPLGWIGWPFVGFTLFTVVLHILGLVGPLLLAGNVSEYIGGSSTGRYYTSSLSFWGWFMIACSVGMSALVVSAKRKLPR